MSDIIEQMLYQNSPRVDFKPETFDTLIYQKGFSVLWEQGMFCSCYDMESGQPDYHCKVCRGKGYVYFGEKVTRALVTSIRGTKVQDRIGLDDVGSAYLTPMSKDNVGFRDRFTFLDFETKYSEVIKRGEDGEVDKLRYNPLSVVSLRSTSGEYLEGRDFSLVERGIQWNSNPLYPGESYSILYNTRPVYIAINPIHELRGTFVKTRAGGLEDFVVLPKQFQIKREDFIADGTVW